jgi:ADP-dependent NAD(P)H-hydrate dehydratase / NAD(P)H-hydrate epimerase
MLPVFTTGEMRGCDAAAVERYGIPGLVLMENAARGAVDVAEEIFGRLRGARVIVLAGRGNNGGDGFAMARHLRNRGAVVDVLTSGPDEASTGDAGANLATLRIMEREGRDLRIEVLEDVTALRARLAARPTLVVDALLGTGLEAELRGTIVDIVAAVNEACVPVLAVDIPTGIHADTGSVMGAAIHARATATMGGLKRGLLLRDGHAHAGTVRVVDIGIPRIGAMEEATRTFLLEREDILAWLPRRHFNAHKYQVGSVFVVAGSVGLTGAATLASEAALRSGAGIVRLAIPQSLNPIMEVKLTEVMTMPCGETAGHSLSLHDYDSILDHVNGSSVGVLGPGVSRHDETLELMRRLLVHATVPLLIDADALFALSGHLDLLRTTGGDVILTPHAGEFSRLLQRPSTDIEAERIDLARAFATEFGVTLVLKGAPTVIAARDGRVAINPTGNPGMATAGAGDVLSGIIGGLRAQGMDSFAAACAGVHLHGLAGDRAVETTGEHGLIATDILGALAGIIRDFSTGAS